MHADIQQDSQSTALPIELTMAKNFHLGCGMHRMSGFCNVDQFPTPATDLVFDLEQPWPLTTDSICQIYCSHTLEHLPNWRLFFQEAWRVLQPGGRLTLRVPYGGHPAAWWDFGHIRPWFIENFAFFQPGYAQTIGNMEHVEWRWPFQVLRIDVRLSREIVSVLRWLPRWLRQRVLPFAQQLDRAIEELFIYMEPLKTETVLQRWLALNAANMLPSQYVCFDHHWRAQALRPGEECALHSLGIGVALNGYS